MCNIKLAFAASFFPFYSFKLLTILLYLPLLSSHFTSSSQPMVATVFWAAALLATLGLTTAIEPIHIPIRRSNRPHTTIGRRALMNSAELFNAQRQGGYLIDLGIGTPGKHYSNLHTVLPLFGSLVFSALEFYLIINAQISFSFSISVTSSKLLRSSRYRLDRIMGAWPKLPKD
jgi:hypothetical protein